MGFFRNRARQKREKAASGLAAEQPAPVTAEPVTTEPETARREVTAEVRPNPDQPGWGRTLGQQIGKAREDGVGRD